MPRLNGSRAPKRVPVPSTTHNPSTPPDRGGPIYSNASSTVCQNFSEHRNHILEALLVTGPCKPPGAHPVPPNAHVYAHVYLLHWAHHVFVEEFGGRGLHSFTFQLNLSAADGIRVVRRGCVALV